MSGSVHGTRSWTGNIYTVSKEILHILWNSKIHYLSLDNIPSNPIHFTYNRISFSLRSILMFSCILFFGVWSLYGHNCAVTRKWRKHIPPKCWHIIIKLHGVTYPNMLVPTHQTIRRHVPEDPLLKMEWKLCSLFNYDCSNETSYSVKVNGV
jgi:hypothetical protein